MAQQASTLNRNPLPLDQILWQILANKFLLVFFLLGVGLEVTPDAIQAEITPVLVSADVSSSITGFVGSSQYETFLMEFSAKAALFKSEPPPLETEIRSVEELTVPSVSVLESRPAAFKLVWDQDANDQIWSDLRKDSTCWYYDSSDFANDGPPKRNVTLWCHRFGQIGPNGEGKLDLSLAREGDEIWLKTRDLEDRIFELKFFVNWIGLLPRGAEPAFVANSDEWTVTLITCALEPGFPENPKSRIFVRGSFVKEAPVVLKHQLKENETLSDATSLYRQSPSSSRETNGILEILMEKGIIDE